MRSGGPEGFLRLEGKGGLVFARAEALEALEALGFAGFSAVMSFSGGDLVGRNRARTVTRISGGGGEWFLKRFFEPDRRGALSVLGLGQAQTQARVEAERAAEFKAAGLESYEVAAFGESADPPQRRSSFLLTRKIEGGADLLSLSRAGASSPEFTAEKRRVIPLLAAAVRRMHDAGLAHPDLYSYHVFAIGAPEEGRFAFIDLHRARRTGKVADREIARDLAGLFLTFPRRAVTAADTVRFLIAYGGGSRSWKGLKKLARRVAARCRRISGRRRFREIRGEAEGGPGA